MATEQNLLQIQDATKSFGIQNLFDAATFAINLGEHVGVIGPNGAGKSTLFKILINEESFDSGRVIKSQQLRLGYLSQHDKWEAEETGNTYLEKNCIIPVWQAKSAGKELQVSEEILDKPILSLSGGYRMRIKLLGLLGMDPNLMLLDEPTNYLDLETTLLLERFLQSFEGAFLLISHDREVLRRTTDHTLEVEGGEIIKYNGNIDDYFEQKELLRSQLAAQAQNQALKRKAVLDFVNRFGAKATKAKQAQSKLKTLAKMEVIEFKPVPIRSAIKIPPPVQVGKSVLRLESADFGYPDKKVLKSVDLEIQRGDHVAVVGLNGVGKSTLLKGLAGTLKPLRGSRVLGYNVGVAIFNQHVVEFLNTKHSVYESMAEVASHETTPQEIRNMAGSLLFSSVDIEKRIGVLSGGEKSRVALGRILLQKVPCLLLDEPTNHLDFQTVEALTQALCNYAGTFIVVSHDRGFIRRVGAKILEVADGHVHLYPGTYDEYVWRLQKFLAETDDLDGAKPILATKKNDTRAKETPDVKPGATGPGDPKKTGKIRRETMARITQLERSVKNLEKQIADLQTENQRINSQLVESGADLAEVNRLVTLLGKNTLVLESLESQWLESQSELEKL